MPSKPSARNRPSRYRVPNDEKVLLTVGSERFAGTLSVLSLTGGTMRVPKRPAPGTFADIKLNTVTGTITAVIEMMTVRGDSSQAFRFIQIDPASKKKLQQALETMEDHGLGDKKADPLDHVIRFARRLIPGKG
ncbi:MAG TPA: PilZ domain-containing protein [Candidatus Koribacter sp.]|jgi:hypothetical protein